MSTEFVIVVLFGLFLIALYTVSYVVYAIWSDKDRDIFIRKKSRRQEE
ncbi:MAG: hypothetical protein OXG39_06980 [Chloroflexi bacterium]|nr:hypothetical protein [Chloroflexota bacterium]